MADLRKKWASDAPEKAEPRVDFRDHAAVFKTNDSVYFVRKTLDSYATLYREHQGTTKKVFQFYFDKEIMAMDVGNTKAVYTEYRPDRRYQYKGSSELVLVDLASDSKKTLTSGQRLYNPRFNKSETKIITTDFTAEQTRNISETFALPGIVTTFPQFAECTLRGHEK